MNRATTIIPTLGSVKTSNVFVLFMLLLRTLNYYSERYLVCQLHSTYLALNGVIILKFFVSIQNDMNDGDEVFDDIPQKKKRALTLC